jgi:hypothetical protein
MTFQHVRYVLSILTRRSVMKKLFLFLVVKAMRKESVSFDESIKNQIWFAIINGQKTIILIDDVHKDFGYLFSCIESPFSHWSEKDCESFEIVKRIEWPII